MSLNTLVVFYKDYIANASPGYVIIVCLFVCCLFRSLAVNSKVVNLVENKPRRLDLLLPLDLHSNVNYILVSPTAELARARVSRWYSIFILQSHSLKQKQLWTSNNTGPIKLFHNKLLIPIVLT